MTISKLPKKILFSILFVLLALQRKVAWVHKSKKWRNRSIGMTGLADFPQRGCYVTLGHAEVRHFVESGATN